MQVDVGIAAEVESWLRKEVVGRKVCVQLAAGVGQCALHQADGPGPLKKAGMNRVDFDLELVVDVARIEVAQLRTGIDGGLAAIGVVLECELEVETDRRRDQAADTEGQLGEAGCEGHSGDCWHQMKVHFDGHSAGAQTRGVADGNLVGARAALAAISDRVNR